jgi:hypothetical protein
MKRILLLIALLGFIAACSRAPQPVIDQSPLTAPEPAAEWLATATPYAIADGDSLLAIRAYRAGRLASLGHNHVISSDALQGRIYVGADYADTWFDLSLPLTTLRVDETQMRARYGDDFAGVVPADAIAGTTANMLGPDVLAAADWPLVSIRGVVTGCAASVCVAEIYVGLKDQVTRHQVEAQVEQHADRLVIHSEFVLSQNSMGLQPFSVMMGALSVADELHFELDLVAGEVVAGELLSE